MWSSGLVFCQRSQGVRYHSTNYPPQLITCAVPEDKNVAALFAQAHKTTTGHTLTTSPLLLMQIAPKMSFSKLLDTIKKLKLWNVINDVSINTDKTKAMDMNWGPQNDIPPFITTGQHSSRGCEQPNSLSPTWSSSLAVTQREKVKRMHKKEQRSKPDNVYTTY